MAQSPSSPGDDTTLRSVEPVGVAVGGTLDPTILGPEVNETAHAGGRDASARLLPRGFAIGRYVVLSTLGEGGMGVVYAAYDPELDRRVAVKVLRPSKSDPSRLSSRRARLLREAQAMAKLSHPNVVSVFDVGALDGPDGNPLVFVAMEYIDGQTLRDWLRDRIDAAGSNWHEILQVFIRAGRGLAAAHRHGIIHRDFKPANVMVDDAGGVTVLDFGLARPPTPTGESSDTSHRLPSSDSFDLKLTATGELLGTPVYMSPEQHRGDGTGPATDQYSFCVALFEALFARRPFDGSSMQELSTRVLYRELAEIPKESVVPSRIRDAVVRGLQRSPDDRFASMEDLLAALAWDPRARSRRLALAGGGLLTIGVVTAAAWSLSPGRQMCRSTDEPMDEVWNRTARQRLRDAFELVGPEDAEAFYNQASTELDRYAETWKSARLDACGDSRIRGEQSEDLYELRLACLDRRLDRFAMTLDLLREADRASVYRSLEMISGLPDVGPCADEELLRTSLLLPDDPETRREVEYIRAQLDRIRALFMTGRYEEANTLAVSLLSRAEQTGYVPVMAEARHSKAELDLHSGRIELGSEEMEKALLEAEASGHDEEIVRILGALVVLEAQNRSRFDVAHAHAARGEAVLERIGHGRLLGITLRAHHAKVYLVENRFEEALQRFEAVRQEWIDAGMARDPRVLYTLNHTAECLIELDRLEEAERVVLEAIDIAEVRLGRRHPQLAETLVTLGRLQAGQGKQQASVEALTRAHEIFRAAFGDAHANVAVTLNGLGLQLSAMGRRAEARERFVEALGVMDQVFGENALQTATLLLNLGSLEREMGEYEAALPHLERGTAIHDAKLPPEDEARIFDHVFMGDVFLLANRLDEARRHHELAWDLARRYPRTDPASGATALSGLGEVARREGDRVRAVELLEQALESLRKSADSESEFIAIAQVRLAQTVETKQPGRARALAREALPILETELAGGRLHLEGLTTAARRLARD